MQKRYPSDLKDEEWEIIEPLIPPALPGGRPRTTNMRELLNAIFYIVRSGCHWNMIPIDFPPKSTVFYYFNRWSQDGTWQSINDALRMKVRVKIGKHPEPSAGIIDSQSVKTTDVGGEHGYDAGKKVNGRKRHILVDTLGLILTVVVHSANIQDRDGAKLVLKKATDFLPRLELIWADAGYAGQLIGWVSEMCQWLLEIVKRPSETRFVLVKKRWIVERTFGWFGKYRRLSKDYEFFPQNSEAMIYVAMIHLMLRRLPRRNTS